MPKTLLLGHQHDRELALSPVFASAVDAKTGDNGSSTTGNVCGVLQPLILAVISTLSLLLDI